MVEVFPLTRGECLLIQRRRLGKSQEEMAVEFGVKRNAYNRYENSKDRPAASEALTALDQHETCLIYRRRKGFTQQQVADRIGLSRLWINRMEHGQEECSQLLKLWGLA